MVFWNATAKFIHSYTKKGDKILVEGSLNTRQYQNSEGKTIYIVEVIADNVEILYRRDKKEEETVEPAATSVSTPTFGCDVSQSNAFAEFGEQVQLDDESMELPF